MWEKQKFFLKTLTNKSRGHDGSRKLPLSNHHSGDWFRYRVEGCLGQNIVYSEYFPAKYLWITKENIYIMMSKSARHQYGQMVKFNVNHRCDGLILCAPDMMYEKAQHLSCSISAKRAWSESGHKETTWFKKQTL